MEWITNRILTAKAFNMIIIVSANNLVNSTLLIFEFISLSFVTSYNLHSFLFLLTIKWTALSPHFSENTYYPCIIRLLTRY